MLRQNGIMELDLDSFPDQDILDIASSFGEVMPGARGELIQLIPARDKGDGPVGSFSCG